MQCSQKHANTRDAHVTRGCNSIFIATCGLFGRCKLDKNGLSPMDKLSTVKNSIKFSNSHVFGCSCCVIPAKSQYHNSMPRWNEDVRVGDCLGRSKNHASNVSLTLNLQTGHVSPQFHVVFDDDFETVDSLRKGTEPST